MGQKIKLHFTPLTPVLLGIDPGLGGAIAVITASGKMLATDTPVIVVKSGKSRKRQIDLVAARAVLTKIQKHAQQEQREIMTVLEKVGAMPGQGVTSMFNFGMGYGQWQGLLAGLGIPYTLVHPLTWKKRMMPDMPKEKGSSIQRVSQLFPEFAKTLNRKKDHGKADAALLAEYGRLVGTQGTSCSSDKTQ